MNTSIVSAGEPSKGRREATAARRDRPCRAGGTAPHASEKVVSVPSAKSAHRYLSCSSSGPVWVHDDDRLVIGLSGVTVRTVEYSDGTFVHFEADALELTANE